MNNVIKANYSQIKPSNQSLIDTLKGSWKSKFPDTLNINAGSSPYFEKDRRVEWVKENFIKDFTALNIIEFGPFEAYNTYRLSQENPKSLTSIEGNNINFLKCLVVKELFKFDATMIHGDFTKYLESITENEFQLAWVSGVLYHQINPVNFIELLAKSCDNIFLWTHYFDKFLQSDLDLYPQFNKEKDSEVKDKTGQVRKLFYRKYMHEGHIPTKFSGGKELHANWLDRETLLELLDINGYKNVNIMEENKNHKAGPTISMYCTKT